MEISKRNALDDFTDELRSESLDAGAILDRLERTGLTLTRAEPTDPHRGKTPRTWLLYCEPEDHIRERFDLAPELLVLLVPSHTAQARDIEKAEQALLRDYRLDRGLVLVAARDDQAAVNLEQSARHTGRTYVFLSFARILDASDPQEWMRRVLLEQLGSSDLFAASAPVFGWDFAGRKREIEAIRKHLLGGRPVGMYGLRKVGKTSLLLVIRNQLIQDARPAPGAADEPARIIVPVHLDLLKVSFAQQNRVGFMRALIKSTYEALAQVGLDARGLGLEPDLGETRRLRELAPDQVDRAGTEMLEMLIDWAREQPMRRAIMLFIDEYERLLGGSEFPQEQGIAILDYLRGLVQSYPGVFNFLVAGLSRRLASTPTLAGRQNPLFNFLVDFPLAGLEHKEMNELVRKISRRLSMRLDHDALALIWEESGGHPFLARELGRTIDKAIPIETRLSRPITREDVVRLRETFRREVESTMVEMGRAVSELAPDILFTLSYLISSPGEADEVLRGLPSEVLDQLCRLGILVRRKERWQVRVGCFGAWLLENWERSIPCPPSRSSKRSLRLSARASSCSSTRSSA